MSIADRKNQEREALRNKIIDAASSIIISEGFDKLSIRKIADAIDYSPGVIYNYFTDKAEIVSYIIENNSNKIIEILKKIELDEQKPDNTLREGLTQYIYLVLENPQQYRAVIMNDDEKDQEKTGMMYSGVAEDKQTIGYLKRIIDIGIEKGCFSEGDGEVLAQIIWASTYGLLSRLIIENMLNEEQKSKLINAHIEFMLRGIKK